MLRAEFGCGNFQLGRRDMAHFKRQLNSRSHETTSHCCQQICRIWRRGRLHLLVDYLRRFPDAEIDQLFKRQKSRRKAKKWNQRLKGNQMLGKQLRNSKTWEGVWWVRSPKRLEWLSEVPSTHRVTESRFYGVWWVPLFAMHRFAWRLFVWHWVESIHPLNNPGYPGKDKEGG